MREVTFYTVILNLMYKTFTLQAFFAEMLHKH